MEVELTFYEGTIMFIQPLFASRSAQWGLNSEGTCISDVLYTPVVTQSHLREAKPLCRIGLDPGIKETASQGESDVQERIGTKCRLTAGTGNLNSR
jgi:hypothetical protein